MESYIPDALAKVGCSSITLKQKECVDNIVAGRDVFLWLPTGFGKSICYEVLPFVFNRKLQRDNCLVLIISPLISLMIDQVRSLRARSVKASILSSKVEASFIARDDDLANNSHLFCAPEALVSGSSGWRDAIDTPEVAGRIVTIVIDEAHCVSKW